MENKASAPPPAPYQAQPMDAPPSYEQSIGQAPPHGAGGFAAPKPPSAQQSGPIPNQGQPVIVQYVNAPNFGPSSVQMMCPHCQCQIQTSTESEAGPMAWILAGILCVVGLWPCACIPCCIESLNCVTHTCPNCKNFLGRYKGGM